MTLNESELAFLHAIRDGDSPLHYARSHHYGRPWAKWMSRKIRRKLGVSTLQEAVQVSEGATITREQFDALAKRADELQAALDDLRSASTESERRAARADVKDARSDLQDELRLRGLDMKDLDRIQSIKEEEKFLKLYEKKKAEEDAAKPKRRRKPKPKPDDDGKTKKERDSHPFARLFQSKDEAADEDDEDDEDD